MTTLEELTKAAESFIDDYMWQHRGCTYYEAAAAFAAECLRLQVLNWIPKGVRKQ